MHHVTTKTVLFVMGLGACGFATAGGRGNLEPQPPMIIKTVVDMKENVLIITGRHFGATAPTVTLADQILDVRRFSEQEVVANLPQGLTAATYGVAVITGGRNRASSNLFGATLPAKR